MQHADSLQDITLNVTLGQTRISVPEPRPTEDEENEVSMRLFSVQENIRPLMDSGPSSQGTGFAFEPTCDLSGMSKFDLVAVGSHGTGPADGSRHRDIEPGMEHAFERISHDLSGLSRFESVGRNLPAAHLNGDVGMVPLQFLQSAAQVGRSSEIFAVETSSPLRSPDGVRA